MILPKSYEGDGFFRLCNNWIGIIPDSFCKKIVYLEIGVFKGLNLFSVSQIYAQHNDSLLFCIDPWCNYDEYPEYQDDNVQNEHYLAFLKHTKDIPKHNNKRNERIFT